MDDRELETRLRAPGGDEPSPRTLARVLLARAGQVFVPSHPAGADVAPDADLEPFRRAVEELGYALDAGLLRRYRALPGTLREPVMAGLLEDLRAQVGADRPHETLPERLARRAGELVEGLVGTSPKAEEDPAPPPPEAPRTVLALTTDPRTRLRALAAGWLRGAAPLRPDELVDLRMILAFDPDLPLPEAIPGKATRAYALAAREPKEAGDAWERWAREVDQHLDTGTDLLRLLAAREGGDPMLHVRPALRGLPRRLRRLALAHLDSLEPRALIEDMRRRPVAFQRLGERLHPFERAAARPRVGLAYAWLRGTHLTVGKRLGDALLPHVPTYDELSVEGGRLLFRGWGSSLERALGAGEAGAALDLLRQRPGELYRRGDHLLRVGGTPEETRAAFTAAAPRVSGAVLTTGLGHFAARRHPLERRVFLPQAGSASPFGIEDTREPLSPAAIAAALDPITTELLTRAAGLPRVDVAVLDEALRDLMVPTGEATASAQRVQLPRGSARPLPDGDELRLFLHWMEPAELPTDLDLSVAFFDSAWAFMGKCDYTQLEFAAGAATHSGDLTSAPAPSGATEFLDLDLPKLLAAGVHHLGMVVYSFNAVPFESLPEAFAGFSIPPEDGSHTFQAAAVRQRFDLSGSALVAVPMFVDLRRRRLRWVDLQLRHRGGLYSVEGTRGSLARTGQDAEALYASGARTTMWELATIHAAARAREVLVRDSRGALCRYRRRSAEADAAFYRRLVARGPGDGPGEPPARDATAFAALVRADLALPAACEVYSLHPDDVPATAVRRQAGELVAMLGPRA